MRMLQSPNTALAADAFCQHAELRAVDAGDQFDRAGSVAGRDQRFRLGGQLRIEPPRPGRGVE